MKRVFAATVLLLSLAIVAKSQPLRSSEITTHSVQSTILGEEVSYNIYLPKGFDATAPDHYPVIYLLHGLYGSHLDWANTGHMKDVVDELMTTIGQPASAHLVTTGSDPAASHG